MHLQYELSGAVSKAPLLGMVVRIFQTCLATVTLRVGSEHGFGRARRVSMDINALLHFPTIPKAVSDRWPMNRKN